jgi:predicted RNA-binding Zn-ribbon protein involved in translation (DUF1610 family)
MDIDIFSIDKKIRDIWTKQQENVHTIDQEIQQVNDILDSSISLSDYIKKDLDDKIHRLQSDKQNILISYENQHFYTMDFSELIERHKNAAPQKISFVTKRSNPSNDGSRGEMTKQYFEILKKYNIDYKELDDITKTQKKEKKLCTNCKSDIFIINTENTEICENCGKQEEKSYKSMSFKDITRVNLSNKYTYERRIHFKDCINQYQGKQNSTIDQKVYDDIEQQLELHGLLKGDKTVTKKIRFENVTKEHILLFLKETSHSKHYEDIVLIYHKMTGKQVDDISHIETQLMEDFDKISDLYDKKFKFTGKIERKSFINTQYVLFQLLRRHRYPCKKEDFNMLKTLDRKSFHDDIVRELFETLNFNFTPIF